MDLNAYTAGVLAHGRLAELRQSAERHHAARAARPEGAWRRALGQALVRLGTRLLGGPTPVRAPV